MRFLAVVLALLCVVPSSFAAETTYKQRHDAAKFNYYIAKPVKTYSASYKAIRLGPAFCVVQITNGFMSCVPDKPFKYTGK